MNLKYFLHDTTWAKYLKDELSSKELLALQELLDLQDFYPPKDLIFKALNLCAFCDVKIIILGQDPYFKKGLATGLSFAVPNGTKLPPSLRNIFKELALEFDLEFADLKINSDLKAWAKQGCLLLNTSLSVQENKPNSHAKYWQKFTDKIIKTLSEKCENLVFMLWGNYAKQKLDLIDAKKHLVLRAAHPSPLARGAFLGCDHFKMANEFLKSTKQSPINWLM